MTASMIVRRGALLAITGVSLYLLAPAILNVFGAWDRLEDINPLWFPAMLLLQAGSYACMWGVQRLALRTHAWGPVITSQLTSNAFGRIVPGGVAASGAMQYAMLTRTGIPASAAASGMTASSVLVFATLCALPVLAVPAMLGGAPVDRGLATAAGIGAGVFALMFALGAACVVSDRPLIVIGRAAQWIRNRVRPRREPLTDLPRRLLRERDIVMEVLGRKWWQALLLASGRWLLDYATLLAALSAVGAHPRPSLVLLAFFAAQLLGTMPLTPGGLGFVEAGLTGTLALAGVPGGPAVLATLAYRLVSFWLPIPAGGVTYLVHRRLYERTAEPASDAGG
ncbi:MAG: flippase-like domain-containing protein [Thermoleophilaceae bacterium]|nr:flippase-like domain-containing protein [Thermoleophilaceae bacterium]